MAKQQITKAQVLAWLEEKRFQCEEGFVLAEEKSSQEGMSKWRLREDEVLTAISIIKEEIRF